VSSVLEPTTLNAIAAYLDGRTRDFQQLGQEFWAVFGAGDNDRISSQVRNLQQVAVSATRFGDVEDFVKNQMGRTTAGADLWRRVGPGLLQQLDTLRQEAARMAAEPAARLRVALQLARGWVRTVVSEYLYRKAQAATGGRR